jgi:ABC-type nitrate/sulfonate/bicarbonate transport system permease component
MARSFDSIRRQVAAANRRFGLGRLRASAVVSIASFFMLWWAITAIGLVAPAFLPSPFAIFPAAAELLTTGELQNDLLMSLIRIGGGFVLACVLGVLLGLLVGLNELIADIFEPLVDLIRQIPPVAWIPLAIIWFGFGEGARIFIVFMGAFPPVMINTTDGVRGVDPQVLRAAASLGANRSAMFWKVSLPAALPSIFTGLTIGLGNAFINIVAAELAGATTGLGYMMLTARESFRTDIVILGMVLLMVIGISLMTVMLAVRRILLRWAFQRDDA